MSRAKRALQGKPRSKEQADREFLQQLKNLVVSSYRCVFDGQDHEIMEISASFALKWLTPNFRHKFPASFYLSRGIIRLTPT